MHASLQKQIAFNRRVLKAEDRIAGLADSLQDVSFDESDPAFICVAADHTMRGRRPVGGQLWKQGDREMTSTNHVLDGMDDKPDSAITEAVA
jgi:hypothetical protein